MHSLSLPSFCTLMCLLTNNQIEFTKKEKEKKDGFIKIGTKDEMKVEILFDEMGGFECYCTVSSLFLILLFSVCSIRHVCSS